MGVSPEDTGRCCYMLRKALEILSREHKSSLGREISSSGWLLQLLFRGYKHHPQHDDHFLGLDSNHPQMVGLWHVHIHYMAGYGLKKWLL